MTSTTTAFTPSPSFLLGLRISRYGGMAVGLVLFIWTFFTAGRLQIDSPYFAQLFLGSVTTFVTLIFLPWQGLPARLWRIFFIVLCFSTVFLSVMLIGEVAYTQAAAQALSQKARPPFFEGALLFLSCLQLPTLFFARHPYLWR